MHAIASPGIWQRLSPAAGGGLILLRPWVTPSPAAVSGGPNESDVRSPFSGCRRTRRDFLMASGTEQVRPVGAAIAGKHDGALELRLVLPETGVCTIQRHPRFGGCRETASRNTNGRASEPVA
jgi:hypothetical protein